MKTILALVVCITTYFAMHHNPEPDTGRNCSNPCTFCTCDITCDEGYEAICWCGIFTCWCGCEKEGQAQDLNILPEMSPTQEANSLAFEQYLRGQGTASHTRIADAVRDTRNALREKNPKTYYAAARIAEDTYSALSDKQQGAMQTWISKNVR